MLWSGQKRRVCHPGAVPAQPCKKSKLVPVLASLLTLVTAIPVAAFDLPNYDPWYSQSYTQGLEFMVPDKAQHFYGSALVNEFCKRLPLPEKGVAGPTLSVTIGFMWEVYQEKNGIGFSERDLIADVLGVAASQISSEHVVIWLDYSIQEKVIMLNFSVRPWKR